MAEQGKRLEIPEVPGYKCIGRTSRLCPPNEFSLSANPKTLLDLSKEFEIPFKELTSRRLGRSELLVFRKVINNET